jgi:hypothetical protein
MNLEAIIVEFTERMHALIEGEAIERARVAVLEAFGASPAPKRGRPSKDTKVTADSGGLKKARKKAPLQLCPVPGCKNAAAPVFGMVCAKHKDVAKSKIRKYREARRAKKLAA